MQGQGILLMTLMYTPEPQGEQQAEMLHMSTKLIWHQRNSMVHIDDKEFLDYMIYLTCHVHKKKRVSTREVKIIKKGQSHQANENYFHRKIEKDI